MRIATGVQLLATLGTTLGPGLLLTALLLPRLRPLDRVVIALPVSIGLWWTASLVEVAPLVSRSWVLTLAVAAFTLYALVVTAAMLTRLRHRTLALLGTLAGLALVAWSPVLLGTSPATPGIDSVSHGVFAARIAELATLDPGTVVDGEFGRPSGVEPFYPLGAHLVAVVSAQATGGGVAGGLQSLVLLSGAVFLPCSLAATCRLLTGDEGASWLAAAAGVALPPLALHKLTWGGLPVLLGMCCVGAVVLLVARLCRDGTRAPRVLALLVVAMTGLTSTHTTQALTAVLLSVGAVGISPMVGGARRAAALAVMTACAAVAVLTTGAWRSAARVATAPGPPADGTEGLADAVVRLSEQNWAGQNGWPLAALVGYGMVVWFRQGLPPLWPLGLVPAVGATFALYVVDWPLLLWVTVPWYSASWRLLDLVVLIGTPIAAYGAAQAGRAVGSGVRTLRVSRHDRPSVARRVVLLAPAVGVLALLALVVEQTALGARPVVAAAVEDNTPVGPDELAAFAFLSEHVDAGDRVLNTRADGAGWLLPLEGVEAVHLVHGDHWEEGEFLTASRALRSAEHGRDGEAVVADFRSLRVSHVFVTGFSFAKYRDDALGPAAMTGGGAYPLVFSSGDVRVFEVPGGEGRSGG